MTTIIKKGADKKSLKGAVSKAKQTPSKKTLDAHRFCGKVKFKKDGIALQRLWRDEWE